MNAWSRALASAGFLFLAAAPGAGHAQSFPSRPITIVVGYPPGGGPDVEARLLGERLSQRLGQAVVVENKPGATGMIGAAAVVRAAPDGYTLLFAPSTYLIAPQVLRGDQPDVLHALAPVIVTSQSTMVMVAHPSLGVHDARELAALARKTPGLAYASPGTGSPMQIVGEMFKKAAGVDMLHVPYKGVAPAVSDVLAGQVKVTFAGLAAVGPYIKSGRLVALATTERQRSPFMPDLPTLAEQGFPNVAMGAWYGVLAPKGTPQPVIDKLNAEFNAILQTPDVAARLKTLWETPRGGTPADLGRMAAAEYTEYGKIIKEFGITAE